MNRMEYKVTWSNRLPILVFLITSIIFNSISAASNESLCETLLSELGRQQRNARTLTAQKVFDALLRVSARQREITPNTGFVTVADPNTDTFHDWWPNLHEPHLLRGNPGDFVALRLPGQNERTVWDALAPAARMRLVLMLEDRFRQLQPDISQQHLDRPLRALYQIHGPWITRVFQTAAIPIRYVGTNPGECGGCCRHASCALAGLLGELGASNHHVRLVSGYTNSQPRTYHVWVEVRFNDNQEWMELDATPRRVIVPTIWDSTIVAIARNNRPRNRQRHSEIIEIPTFLSPINTGTIRAIQQRWNEIE